MGDLKDPKAIYFKAFLFLLCGTVATALLILESPTLKTALLITITIWSFCRLYYFMFCVIERYVDGDHRFSGIIPCVIYLLNLRHQRKDADDAVKTR